MIQICFERIRYHLTFTKKKIWFNMCAKMLSTVYTEINIFGLFYVNGYFFYFFVFF